VQVDPMKPTSKAPGIKLLKLKYEKSLSNFAFKLNLRRYIEGHFTCVECGKTPVGRCRLTLSKPVLKAPVVSALDTRI